MFPLLGKLALALHALGLASAVVAIMRARTSQGAIAWAISLATFPYLSLPLFWIFGRDRFNGYSVDRRSKDSQINHLRRQAGAATPAPPLPKDVKVFETLAGMRFTGGNDAKLCINGAATFDAIFAALDVATEYVLVQFFIFHDDDLGRELKRRLIEVKRRGVRIYFLYDEIGSKDLPRAYKLELSDVGIEVRPFKTTKGAKNRFQINFRNHRKVVVVDGRIAFIGGLNVGDEYMGRSKKFGAWRDTHVRLEGPCVLQVQASFVEDWHWSSGVVPNLHWESVVAPNANKAALIIPSGPADNLDTCCLIFLQAIHAANQRIWITSPYFVPDAQIISALQLAVMRGVDVRIILPSMPDHFFVYMASFSFLKDAIPHGVKLYRYQRGFLHQKVLLVDDSLASVGTANFDNRSFRLNFEITALFADRDFASEVEAMLLEDLAQSEPVRLSEIASRPFYFKVAVQVSRLLAPIL